MSLPVAGEEYIPLDGISYYTLLEHPASGPGTKGCIVLIHAIMSNLHMWDSTVPALHGAEYSTLRIDHVGHHKSSSPLSTSPPLSLENLLTHLYTLTQRRLTRSDNPNFPPLPLAAVIGCSIGGVLSLRWAMQHPSPSLPSTRFISICAPGLSSTPATLPMWASRIAQLTTDGRSGTHVLAQQTVDRWLPGDEARDVAARREELGRVRTATLDGYRVLATAIADFDFEADLGRVRDGDKVLVVAGGRDTSSKPEVLRGIAERVKGRFIELSEVGHIPSVHDAEAFNEVVLGFLGETE